MKKEKIQKITLLITMTLSLFLLDYGIRTLLYKSIDFVSLNYLPAIFFTINYIITILIIYLYKPKIGKILYILFIIIFNIYAIAQIIHFNILDRIITITDALVADQATGMTLYIIEQIKFEYLVPSILSLIFFIFSIKLMKKTNYNLNRNIFIISFAILLATLPRIIAISCLGEKTNDDSWNFWNNEKNIYLNYNNPSRSFIVSGIYEYFFRDIYTYCRDILTNEDSNNINQINTYINNLDYQLEKNEYSNIFKDKNIIMIMLESIDSWLVNEEIMPTLTSLKNSGLDFTNRYSPTFGGGSTINTEFASLTGLYATITYKPIYKYDKNDFSNALPFLFKNNGYKVNSIHMNTGTFYNRDKFHLTLGFDKHYAMADLNNKTNFQYDTNLIKNNESYNYIIDKENKFLTYITTYSAHVPYLNNDICKTLDTKKFEIKNDEETTCLKTLANETDNFIKLLIERLKEDNLLEDTVIVLFTDHYTYGYSDSSKWTKIKDTKLSQHTTFVIWNTNIEPKKIDIINDSVDIPPTIFNMFGINYNPKLYLGTDIFSKYHEQFVYFNDYSWLSPKLYYTGKQNYDNLEYIENISNIVNNKIKINEKIITSDFYNVFEETH